MESKGDALSEEIAKSKGDALSEEIAKSKGDALQCGELVEPSVTLVESKGGLRFLN